MNFFENISLLDHPPCSPDLNPIENLWGLLVSKVYARGKQYSNAECLKKEILLQWDLIGSDKLELLVKSMDDRIFEVIKACGGATHY